MELSDKQWRQLAESGHIEICTVEAGTRIVGFGNLLILAHPTQPLRFIDKGNLFAGAQEVRFTGSFPMNGSALFDYPAIQDDDCVPRDDR